MARRWRSAPRRSSQPIFSRCDRGVEDRRRSHRHAAGKRREDGARGWRGGAKLGGVPPKVTSKLIERLRARGFVAMAGDGSAMLRACGRRRHCREAAPQGREIGRCVSVAECRRAQPINFRCHRQRLAVLRLARVRRCPHHAPDDHGNALARGDASRCVRDPRRWQRPSFHALAILIA
jgi:hypothetical protein